MKVVKHWYICNNEERVEIRGFLDYSYPTEKGIEPDMDITVYLNGTLSFTFREGVNPSFYVNVENEVIYFDWASTLYQNLNVTLMSLPSVGVEYDIAVAFEETCNSLNAAICETLEQEMSDNTLLVHLAGHEEIIPIEVYAKVNGNFIQGVIDSERCVTYNEEKLFDYDCDDYTLKIDMIPTIKNVVIHNVGTFINFILNNKPYKIKSKNVCEVSYIVL